MARSRAELERLVDEQGRRLYHVARHICRNDVDAEDIVQETLLSAHRAWDKFEGRSSPETWLYTIAKRACMRMRRRRSGEPARLESLDALMPRPSASVPDLAAGDGPERAHVRREARAIVERALARMPLSFRMPIVLADVAELSTAEIAKVLGIKEATVKTRVHRARLKLRQVLAAGLPKRTAPHADHPRASCLELLQAKLEAMDRGVKFPYSDEALCARCRVVFATLDLGRDTCATLRSGPLPPAVRSALRRAMRDA